MDIGACLAGRAQQRICLETKFGRPCRGTRQHDQLAIVANMGGQHLLAEVGRTGLLQLADQLAPIPCVPDNIS